MKKDIIYKNIFLIKNNILECCYNTTFSALLENIEDKIEYFKPIAKTKIKDGVRYFEVDRKDEKSPSIIRYIDVTNTFVKKPSKWFEVDIDTKGYFYVEDGLKHYIGDLDIEENLEKIPIKIKKEQKNKYGDNYSIWKCDLFVLVNNDTKMKTLCNIYTNQNNFPTRTFLDKLRYMLNATVSYSPNKIKITPKIKNDNDNTEEKILFISKRDLENVDDNLLNDLMKKHKNDVFYTPEEFLDFLRKNSDLLV